MTLVHPVVMEHRDETAYRDGEAKTPVVKMLFAEKTDTMASRKYWPIFYFFKNRLTLFTNT